jgi:hypothetical protein
LYIYDAGIPEAILAIVCHFNISYAALIEIPIIIQKNYTFIDHPNSGIFCNFLVSGNIGTCVYSWATQALSRAKVNILGREGIGHCEKKKCI